MNEQFILTLIKTFNSSGITELKYSDGESEILLKKESGLRQDNGAVVPGADAGNGQGQGQGQKSAVHLGMPVSGGETGESITSPIVATFYNSPAPDAPPFVKPGSAVKAGDTLCILEAMKMMNHLEAEFDCEILSAEVGTGELVEYGQTLFRVRRV